jgi:putative toxin-antitoxin system antitoxin component (TIGR02293 family)
VTIHAERVAQMLGGSAALGAEVTTLRELRLAVEAGLPVESLEHVARHIATHDRQVAEIKHRIVPRSTLARRQRLTLQESERVERLARITVLAEEVWESRNNAREFLHGEQHQLGGARPIELSISDLGAREVEDLLARLEFSLPA